MDKKKKKKKNTKRKKKQYAGWGRGGGGGEGGDGRSKEGTKDGKRESVRTRNSHGSYYTCPLLRL